MKNSKFIYMSVFVAVLGLLFCSCTSKADKEKEDVISSVKGYSNGIISLDFEKISNYAALNLDEENKLKDVLDSKNYSDYEIYETIAKTITYEVDENSYVYNQDTGLSNISLNYSMVDYESVIGKSQFLNSEEVCNAISSEKNRDKTFIVKYNLIKVDGKWCVNNMASDNPVFDLFNVKVQYVNTDVYSAVDFTDWFGDVANQYTNTDKIELDTWFTDDIYSMEEFDYYYVVSVDGQQVVKSDVIKGSKDKYIPVIYSEVEENGYLKSGEYEIKVFLCDNDRLLSSSKVSVIYDKKQITPSPTPLPEKYSVEKETDSYVITDDEFIKDIIHLGWWDYNATMESAKIYPIGTSKISFSIQVKDDINKEIFYSVYYTDVALENIDELVLTSPVYQTKVMPKHYENGTYYDFEYESTNLEGGFYYIVASNDSENSKILIKANCQVKAEAITEPTPTKKP